MDGLDEVVERALREDAPWGDITSEAIVPENARITAEFVARQSGVMSGGAVIAAVYRHIDPSMQADVFVDDGKQFAAGTVLARVQGSARCVLLGERTALNLVQRMCGIATTTARYVDAVAGTKARIADTRKTVPGLRILDKYAVRCGGGVNHRFSLSDAVLVKDNHLATVAEAGLDTTAALRQIRDKVPHTTHIEVEVDGVDQIAAVLGAGVDTIMFDNFSDDELRRGVAQVGGRAKIEASGGVSLETVRSIAATGVDIISVGALTHSVIALDIALDMRRDA